jgi:hypothetical protein
VIDVGDDREVADPVHARRGSVDARARRQGSRAQPDSCRLAVSQFALADSHGANPGRPLDDPDR